MPRLPSWLSKAFECLAWSISPRRDVVFTFEHIARESGTVAVGRRFVGQLRQQWAKLASLPRTRGRARPELRPDIRSAPYKNYVIFFHDERERLEGANILEGHQDLERHFGEEAPQRKREGDLKRYEHTRDP